ncbi:MAG TPA: DUF4178 domain-containing protein [Chloroflexota bacterium]|nr:DUF4178 domain-containing protein [Chloroflexota bacterium]
MIKEERPSSAPVSVTTGGALGTGLMIVGVVVGALVLLWLTISLVGGQLTASGFSFSLILLAILALPLVGAGWYLRRQGVVEQVEAETFAARRPVLDSDRVVRQELARELDQRSGGLMRVARALPPTAAEAVRGAAHRLEELAGDVRHPGYDTTTWLEHLAARLDRRQLEQLQRYDDLVLAEARRLEQIERDLMREPHALGQLAEAVERLANYIGEREALVSRGKRPSELGPQEILAAGAVPRRALQTPLELGLDDAVSYAGEDYIVRAVLTYFAGARTWRTYQLYGGEQREQWLEVRANGAEVTWYEPRPAPETLDEETVTLDGVPFTLAESGSATVGVESSAGRRDGVFVEFRRFAWPNGRRLVVERWPDGLRALLGTTIAAEDLELWTKPPAAE